ncbi:MAG: hypothetical protein AB1482_04380, partial [Pseudomonadota bacterium]
GISIAALADLISRGQVERQFDGARVVYLDAPASAAARAGRPQRPARIHRPGRCDPASAAARAGRPQPRLYALLDASGDVLTVEKRVRLGT